MKFSQEIIHSLITRSNFRNVRSFCFCIEIHDFFLDHPQFEIVSDFIFRTQICTPFLGLQRAPSLSLALSLSLYLPTCYFGSLHNFLKAFITFVLSLLPTASKNSAPKNRMCVKLRLEYFKKKSIVVIQICSKIGRKLYISLIFYKMRKVV
jgi:hypothetical protein